MPENLNDDELQNVFCPLVIRLSGCEWFTGRISACALFQHAYARSNAQKERLRKKFMELCQEDTPNASKHARRSPTPHAASMRAMAASTTVRISAMT